MLLALAALAAGTWAAFHYAHDGLTLSHYDARAHLVVARRIIDSLTPGWMQIGAVWLPLPHLLNMLPVQVDAWYRTGASAVAISVLSMAATVWAVSSMIVRFTGSANGALTAAVLLVANPNVLYLQSTPMTEPLLFATTMLTIALTARWVESGGTGSPAPAGIAAAAACLTRYEAWPVTAVTIVLAVAVLIRRGLGARAAIVACSKVAAYPLAAVCVFLLNSRWTVGEWFVTGGFFVPENAEALGHPVAALHQVRDGLVQLSGGALAWSGYAGAVIVVAAALRSRARAPLALLVALAAAGALPWYAYLQGHPFRIRYDLPLVAAAAALAGAGVGLLWSRVRPIAALAIITTVLMQTHPLDPTAPLVVESQRDRDNMAGRRSVTDYLVRHHDGRTIMMSMGSLGHYMQDLAAAGFDIHDFLHEGNGELWTFALLRPAAQVEWMAIEERSEGGDVLFQHARRNARFLQGFTRVAEGGGVALYRVTKEAGVRR